jgi:hypothetical protein
MEWKSPEERVQRAQKDYLGTIDNAKPFFDFLRFLITSGAVATLMIFTLRDALGRGSILSGIGCILCLIFLMNCFKHLYEIVRWWSLYHAIKLSIRWNLYDSIQSGKLNLTARIFIWVDVFVMIAFWLMLLSLIFRLVPAIPSK